MTKQDPNALAKCQKIIANIISDGSGLLEAKAAIARMLSTRRESDRRLNLLQTLDRFIAIPATHTMRSKMMAYNIGREIDRLAKTVKRRQRLAAHKLQVAAIAAHA